VVVLATSVTATSRVLPVLACARAEQQSAARCKAHPTSGAMSGPMVQLARTTTPTTNEGDYYTYSCSWSRASPSPIRPCPIDTCPRFFRILWAAVGILDDAGVQG
jgi:hypothetical protein